jgi:hypothetical protein
VEICSEFAVNLDGISLSLCAFMGGANRRGWWLGLGWNEAADRYEYCSHNNQPI